jgi:hypothetical protein
MPDEPEPEELADVDIPSEVEAIIQDLLSALQDKVPHGFSRNLQGPECS